MNKSLLIAKKIDVYGQLAMIVLPLVAALADDDALSYIVFTLGFWQLGSYILHTRLPHAFWKRRSRKACRITLIVLFGFGLVGLSGQSLGLVLLPLMAMPVPLLWYLIISVGELRTIEESENRKVLKS